MNVYFKNSSFVRSIVPSIKSVAPARRYIKPPTYFSNDVSPVQQQQQQQQQQAQSQLQYNEHLRNTKFFSVKDYGFGLLLISFIYFSFDNYLKAKELEGKVVEQINNNHKALAIAQMSFNKTRKKREMQILNERSNNQKREMKMVLHVAMLRKQLRDNGIEPVNIDDATAEFEKNVKMENSMSNLSGTSLWVVDDAPIKSFVPNIHEYDRRKS
ncbi:uncharacterized protein ASCRUDRAFT_78355 [Ascoidea rubescens DSM 1968]|uniref:Uncharacterized protein n=1 Tax=Ascoidea rubescens DSM 1968 TaxID=1344418 RepID=A0A1D2V834_9ASCO|nr:hypothetical protein ASCRUDRAFT_78355 [Ascoidea rubescens DSM 1968]ODV57831.1 hypothetical protein ASCRUDRAFT_78355 [Ascoidea rubescens DSM 1968]